MRLLWAVVHRYRAYTIAASLRRAKGGAEQVTVLTRYARLGWIDRFTIDDDNQIIGIYLADRGGMIWTPPGRWAAVLTVKRIDDGT